MFSRSKAFEVEAGLLIGDSTTGPLITGGTASPVGLDLPVGTIYFQPVGNGFELWGKTSALASDWSIKQFVAKAFVTEFFASNAVSTTTSNVFQNKVTATTAVLESGTYLVQWSLEYTNTSNNRNSEVQVVFDGATIALDNTAFVVGGIYAVRSALFFTDTISGAKNMSIQYRQTNGGTAGIRRATIGYIKVL